MTFDDLANVALLGTGRAPVPPLLPASDDALGRALAATAGQSPEAHVLGAAALLAAYESCGAVLPVEQRPIEPAPADARPSCSPRAAALLNQILALANAPAKQQIVAEWLAGANSIAQRAPHASIVPLLDYGGQVRALRDSIAQVVDARGRWLMAQNARWQFAAGDNVDLDAIWSTGNREQRASALRRHRKVDAPAARLLVESTWREDGADERAAFVEAMQIGLSPADEAFLERALDDRSKQVRAAAIDGLARLPASAFVERMIARAAPRLTFRSATPRTIAVTLPADEYDADWARDGIVEKPIGRLGRRQWWLKQMIEAVPPARWSTRWEATPAECMAALSGDFVELVRGAWSTAAARVRDVDWIAALVEAAAADATNAPPMELLSALNVRLPPGTLGKLIASPKLDEDALAAILSHVNATLDEIAERAILAKIEACAEKQTRYDYALANLLDRAALRLSPERAIDATSRWAGAGWETNRRSLDAFVQTLQLRRDIRREFTR